MDIDDAMFQIKTFDESTFSTHVVLLQTENDGNGGARDDGNFRDDCVDLKTNFFFKRNLHFFCL